MEQRIHLFGLPIDNLTLESIFAKINILLKNRSAGQIITANSVMLNNAYNDQELAQIFRQAALIIPESSGISWAVRFLFKTTIYRIPGIDLMLALCQQAEKNDWKVYLLGGRPGVAEKAQENLIKIYPNLKIVGGHNGYSLSEILIKEIQEQQPQLIFVGMNSPEQEKWINLHLKDFRYCLLMGVGGSLDVISGIIKRAPEFFQKTGLEWFYRTLRQPWRIKRILQLPVFIWRVLNYRRKFRLRQG